MSTSSTSSVEISDVTQAEIKEQGWLQAVLSNQAFNTVTVALICVATALESRKASPPRTISTISLVISPPSASLPWA
ncbi:MAG: hypothetical protein R3C97_03160 [Geminicoccaceae bacterium]